MLGDEFLRVAGGFIDGQGRRLALAVGLCAKKVPRNNTPGHSPERLKRMANRQSVRAQETALRMEVELKALASLSLSAMFRRGS